MPMPGGVDVDAVALAALDDLRVAGRDDHARLPPRRRAIEAATRRSSATAKPSSTTNAGREHERPCAGDGEIVDRAVDGELADVAAGEEERLDDVGVGREREPRAVQLDDRRIAERVEQRVAELLEEEPFDERARRLAAGRRARA